MTDIEQLLRSDADGWLERQPVPPPLDSMLARAMKHRHLNRTWLAVAATVLVVAGVALVPLVASNNGNQAAGTTASTVVTIEAKDNDPSATKSVQLRDATTGKVLRTLLKVSGGATSVDAASAPDGSILVSSANACSTRLERFQPKGGSAQLVRTVNENASGIALSPDGSRLAYLTYPSCAQSPGCPGYHGSCQPIEAPTVLVVLDLNTGAMVRTTAGDQSARPSSLSWSPDGTQLLGYDSNGLIVVDAAHPSIDNAHRVPLPPGDCSFTPGVWSSAGVVTDEYCQSGQSRLVRLSAAGINSPTWNDDAIDATWNLPSCAGTGGLVTDASRSRVFVDTGYTGGTASSCPASGSGLAIIDSALLRTLTWSHISHEGLTLVAAPPHGSTSTAPTAASTFVTIGSSGSIGSSAGPQSVQLRDGTDGHVIRTLLSADGTLGAARERDGSILVTTTTGCTTRVERVDPDTGHRVLVRTINEDVSSIVLSPDGSQLAYEAYASCAAIPHCSSGTACLAIFGPNVLVIMKLTTGTSVRVTSTPGASASPMAWSPDGRQLLAGDEGGLFLLDPSTPSLVGVHHIPLPPGNCTFSGAAWTQSGIVTSEGCASGSVRLVQLQSAAVSATKWSTSLITASWPMPTCGSPGNLITDATRTNAYVEIGIGYGNDVCAKYSATNVAVVEGGQLRTIFAVSNRSPGWTLVSG